MKITLLYAKDYSAARFEERRTEFPPNGLLYLASTLEKNGYYVELIDIVTYGKKSDKFSDVIGISVNTTYSVPVFLNEIRNIRANCNTLVGGGQHISIFPEESIKSFFLDYAIIGEGEYSLLSTLNQLAMGKKADNIPGLAKIENGSFISYEPQRITNLNQLPLPSRHMLSEEDILLNRRIPGNDINAVAMITSRGCQHVCAFCGNLYKNKIYYHSSEYISNELDYIQNNYDIGGIVFLDENLLNSSEHLKDVCGAMSGRNLKWTANARADSVSNDKLELMANSGCIEIKFGVESGSSSMLRRMNKGITINDIVTAVTTTKLSGIRTKAFMLYGFPGENLHTINETISLLTKLKPYLDRVNIFNFAPLPNSPCFKNHNDYGIIISDQWSDYKIYHQNSHWWGNENDHKILLEGYGLLREFVRLNYGGN